MSGSEARIALRFRGRVQGVGFRATAASIAGPLGLRGWVRNEADGTVTAEAQGTSIDLGRFLDELRSEMGDLIEVVERRHLPLRNDLPPFRIWRD